MKVHNTPITPTNPEAVENNNLQRQSAARQSTKGGVKLHGHQLSSAITKAPRPPAAKSLLGKLSDGARDVGSKLHDKWRHPKPMPRLPNPELPWKIPTYIADRLIPGRTIVTTELGGDLSRLVGMSVKGAKAMARKCQIPQVRILSPNSLVTMEYRSNRLNLHVNDSGVVTRATWG